MLFVSIVRAFLGVDVRMNNGQLRTRTKSFALRVIRLYEALPSRGVVQVIGHQLLKSGTSVGANYRASCRAKSTKDMIAKLKIVEEEADESAYWMETLIDAQLIAEKRLKPLLGEANEIVAMTVASIQTLRRRG